MKKSLIALAVAGAFVAPAAMAEVTISGAINLGIEASKSNNGGFSKNYLNANYSNFNLSSTDDIGNGNKVIFNYQFDVSATAGGNPANLGAINNRNSYLGIAGNWGAFKMGTNENVYERFMYQADPIDGALGPGGNLMLLGTPGANTAFEVGQSGCGPAGGCVGFYRRSDNTIWYESPNWNGFSFEVDYTLSAGKTATGQDPKLLSLGGKYAPEGMPFYIDVAYEKHDDMFGVNKLSGQTDGTGSSDTGFQIGGGYMIGDLGLHLRYEMLKYEVDGSAGPINEYKRNAYWFGAKYNLPSGYIGAEIGIAQEGETNAGDVNDSGARMIGVGYFHNLSKQSQLQFIYGRTDNDDAATYTQAGATSVAAGADHQVFHVGIKHTF
ncbi:MAG TPA: porin [Burkholderiales bacterium]|jgi:predicted porin|nr:porin [Burkholderiales bacterium]